jgi:hypothetical protein
VREILDYYNEQIDPLEAFKINQVKLQVMGPLFFSIDFKSTATKCELTISYKKKSKGKRTQASTRAGRVEAKAKEEHFLLV